MIIFFVGIRVVSVHYTTMICPGSVDVGVDMFTRDVHTHDGVGVCTNVRTLLVVMLPLMVLSFVLLSLSYRCP